MELREAIAGLDAAVALAGVAGLVAGLLLGALGTTAFVWLVRDRLHHRLGDRFHALSAEALDRSSDRFLALAGERLGALEQASAAELSRREAAVESLVQPLRDSLTRVDEKLARVESERRGHYESLTKHLELVASAHRELGRETQRLGQALRTPNVRGRWGELQLRRVVELAGMLDHCDFEEQPTLRGTPGDGPSARPDLVVHLPGGRRVVVDAKAPLASYLAASEAEGEAERRAHLEDHARHVRRHLDQLSTRAYGAKLEPSPEFVVLFLPGEPFFAAALAHDPELIERGVDRRVLLAGPTTLIALLRAIAYGWQQERMAENAAEIWRIGRELHERLGSLNEHFRRLGRRLDGAVEAYNAAMGSLESRVQVSARRMAELGTHDAATLPVPDPLERRTRRVGEDGADHGGDDRDAADRDGEGRDDGAAGGHASVWYDADGSRGRHS